jgi:hypothetical protein
LSYGELPALTVRDWPSVLDMRRPDWGCCEEDDDGVRAAEESRRIHELRGVIIGQVSEIESLMAHVSSQIRARSGIAGLPRPPRRAGAGGILGHLEELLDHIGMRQEFVEEIAGIRLAIHRRNTLVHAVVRTGFAYVAFNDSRDSVIVILSDNDHSQVTDHASDANWDDPAAGLPEGDLSPADLERQLAIAWRALDSCLDIWEKVDTELPRAGN